ncbi:MAG: hypothetical protein CBD18_01920 [Opitutales bacterium TMED158]|nr:MAG: hypothetical protein CBD18_01920 [Opitutales bacterium TMED158]
MARPKEFDTEESIAAAGEQFRRKGYEATSTEDLLQAMGIGRGSLYAAFGTKQALFDQALEQYRDEIFSCGIELLENSENGRDGLKAFFSLKAGEAGMPVARDGCLIVNSTVELGPRNALVAAALAESWKRLEDAFFGAIQRAQMNGQIDRAKSPRSLALFCVTLVRGLSVGGKLDLDSAKASKVTELAMDALFE